MLDPNGVGLREVEVGSCQVRPFLRSPRIGLQQMRDRQPRPQRRAMTAVEGKQRFGPAVVQRRFDAALEIFPGPSGAEALAFESEICDLVEWIEHPQALVELQAVDDLHRPAEPDVLRPQIAVGLDDAARPDQVGEHGCMTVQEFTLSAIDAPNQPRRKGEARVEQHPAVIGEAFCPAGEMRSSGGESRPRTLIELRQGRRYSLELPSFEASI